MKKYDVRFCECGRVHFIENEKIDKAIENGKQVMVVCNHCGDSYVIGANKGYNEYLEEDCYSMYSYSLKDTVMNDLSNIDCIIFSSGEQVRMMTGGEATYCGNGFAYDKYSDFIDWETKKPDDVSEEEWDKMRRTVHTQHTINWIRDDEKLESMCGYAVGIDWIGTKYEKDWMKL